MAAPNSAKDEFTLLWENELFRCVPHQNPLTNNDKILQNLYYIHGMTISAKNVLNLFAAGDFQIHEIHALQPGVSQMNGKKEIPIGSDGCGRIRRSDLPSHTIPFCLSASLPRLPTPAHC